MTDLYKDRPGFCDLEELREGAAEEQAKDVKSSEHHVSLATYEKLLDAYTALLAAYMKLSVLAYEASKERE